MPVCSALVIFRSTAGVATLATLTVAMVLLGGAAPAPLDDDAALQAIDDLLERGLAAAALAQVDDLLAAAELEERNRWRAQQRRGAALVALGRPAEAVPVLEAAIRDVPEDAASHLILGRALRDLGTRGRAVAHFQTAVRLAGDDPLWRLEYAELLRDLGALGEAARQIAAARTLCGDCTAAVEAAADLALRANDFRAAIDPLTTLLGRGGGADIRGRLVAALWNHGDAAAVHAVLDTVPGSELSADEVMILAQADRQLGKHDRAVAWAAPEPEGLPMDWRPPARFWAITAEICLNAGVADAALRAIDRALAEAPTEAIYHHNRAAALVQLGRDEEARAALAEARRLDPSLGDDR